MRYRRAKTKGGTYFFTWVTYQRMPLFNDRENVALLRNVIREVKNKHPFKIDAFVILPDHLHFIWTLSIYDNDYPKRWRLIKSNFTKLCPKHYKFRSIPSRKIKGEQCIWQRRYWEHQISDENDFASHVDYIHYNPVKHGLVKNAIDWPHSSFNHYVKTGIYPINWGSAEIVIARNIGKE